MAIWTPITDAEKLTLPTSILPEAREEWTRFWERLVAAQRHEDNLLNSRLQSFIVGTALLMAAVAQFRDDQYLPVAVAVCLAGFVLSGASFRILGRTARTIEWYIDALVRLDVLLYPEPGQQLYAGRQRGLGELRGAAGPPAYPLNAILGVWVPIFVGVIWLGVLLAFTWLNRHRLFG